MPQGCRVPDVLVSSDGLERGKPDPACFLIAARRLEIEPCRCVVIEDAPAGIRAGRAAGASVIAVRTTHADDELSEADAIVDGVSRCSESKPCRRTHTCHDRTDSCKAIQLG